MAPSLDLGRQRTGKGTPFIRHSPTGNVMQPFLDTGEMVRSLTDADGAGMRALYGLPETPTPAPNDQPYRSTLGAISRD